MNDQEDDEAANPVENVFANIQNEDDFYSKNMNELLYKTALLVTEYLSDEGGVSNPGSRCLNPLSTK